MDKQTFVQNLALVKSRKILLLRIGLSLLFVTLCVSIYLTKTRASHADLLTFKLIAMAVLAAVAYASVTMIQNMCRRLGLYCPNCKRNLSGALSHKVVATDSCFQCGTKLF